MLTIIIMSDARYEEKKADAMTFFEIALVIARELDWKQLFTINKNTE